MEVNQVRFGNYTVGNSNQKSPKKEEKSAQESNAQVSPSETKSVDREDLLNAMNMIGLQNRPQINSVGLKEVDPTEFLSEERITDIEALMAEFEAGVNNTADIIGKEFPEMSEANKNALAARIFAQE